MIIVKKDVLEEYLNLEIDDQDLFPENTPSGTSFYELEPENDETAICTSNHVLNLLQKFKAKEISQEKLSEWVESLIALDLFSFDESVSEEEFNWISNTIFTLDELKDKGTIKNEDIDLLISNSKSFIH